MDNDETGRNRPADERPSDEPDAEESLALGPFILAIGECAELLARLRDRVDDHLGVPPGQMAWGHVADADRLLLHLRQAAFAAGALEEPAP